MAVSTGLGWNGEATGYHVYNRGMTSIPAIVSQMTPHKVVDSVHIAALTGSGIPATDAAMRSRVVQMLIVTSITRHHSCSFGMNSAHQLSSCVVGNPTFGYASTTGG